MCYNCGCGIKDDDMGYGKVTQGGGGLVEEDLIHIAQKTGMTLKDTKKEIYKLLKKQIEEVQV